MHDVLRRCSLAFFFSIKKFIFLPSISGCRRYRTIGVVNWTFNLRRCNVSFIFGLANNELSGDLSYGAMQKSDTSKTYQFENEITFSPRVFVKNVSLASDPRDSACLKV